MIDRRKPGRGSQLTPDERQEIQQMALVQGLSQSEISRRTGRDRGTIANVISADDTQSLKAKLDAEMEERQVQEASRILRRNTAKVATDWIDASGVAATRGDHRPSRDLLLHTRVIDPIEDGGRSNTKIQIVLNGGPHPPELSPITAVISIGTEPRPELPAADTPDRGRVDRSEERRGTLPGGPG
jgi:transposase-like protein